MPVSPSCVRREWGTCGPDSFARDLSEGGEIVLDPKLLEILACPQCKKPVTPLPDHSALDCPACGLRYKVEKGIPIMLIEEAEQLPRED
jgi:uncharacterized protein YbaR (Trm112 family)